MLKKIFKKESGVELYSPLSGEINNLINVNDPVFNQKMMGEGIAIKPTSDVVLSPFDGDVIQLFETNHAIGLSDKSGNEVLIHIGLDTVNLKGEGFTKKVEQGDKVSRGQPLIVLNLDYLKSTGKDLITPIIVTNNKKVHITNELTAVAGETLLINILE
ncbi:MAG TPA: PTS glucose transporter subunit IIA [Pseudogracilibacillus sp.]|nr:PTS glucose transporter subunit IIA [Pseudogracilibacillus sp.]